MGAPKKKCRQYSTEYLKYGFIQSPSNPQQPLCLICEKTFTNEETVKINKTLKQKAWRQSRQRSFIFQSLRDSFKKRLRLSSIFLFASSQSSDGLRASYNLSLMIAKSGKPHTIGEQLLLPVVNEVLRATLHMPVTNIIKKLPLSNNTVQR
ncbi:LOW QUALITY PROTEIN: hypothetical protein M513_02399 [Trichuris suis]|uniref:Uncharacterized protein n=1 Tax=Trichuris suis TaxID=68888 RepID=A0A085MHM6_9BILA|nr:LOW QUALITY PROTEIN: hypothetical protein M513_02399 [Trichuris suis]